MKKKVLIVSGIVLVLVVASWFFFFRNSESDAKASPVGLIKRTAKVERQPIKVQVVATGQIQPIYKVEIKSKASGEVLSLKLNEGDFVKKGTVIALIEKTDALAAFNQAEGKTVHRLLVEQGMNIERELYLGITLDRSVSKNVLMISTEGGMDIEAVAEHSPEKILKLHIHPLLGLQAYQAREAALFLQLSGEQFKNGVKFITALYNAYLQLDCSLAEINPLVVTKEGDVIALDAKINFDDNALFRHPEYAELRDESEEDPLEVEASKSNLNYVRLDGNVGCMVNGAGLAMATMDIIQLAGGKPANFLDVGGGANAKTVEAGFRIILGDKNVKAILINIFGGIVRCDRVAAGVIEAAKNIGLQVPVIVRLEGTNADIAQKMLDESGLNLISAQGLKDAAEKVTKALAA